jgi:tetratricopeptide (TPR) repeat protein
MVASALQNLALVHRDRGEVQQAGDVTARLVALSARLGADHPRHATRLRNAAAIETELGHYDDAIAHGREALAIFERWYGSEHRSLDEALNNLAIALRLHGDTAEARALFERLQGRYAARFGAGSQENAEAEANLAIMELEAGELDAAAARAGRAIAALEAALGPDHADLVTAQVIAGGIARYRGRLAESTAHLERAVAIAERALGAEHVATINPRIELASTALAAGEPARAVEVLTPSLQLIERLADVPPPVAAEARFVMAQALRAARRDPGRARALADAARALYAGLGEPFAAQLAAVDAWLAAP